MSKLQGHPLLGDVVVSSGSGGLHFSRTYSRAPTPVSPQVSMASASGISVSDRFSISGRSSTTPFPPFQPHSSSHDGDPIARPPSISGSTISSVERTAYRPRSNPRPKSPITSSSPRLQSSPLFQGSRSSDQSIVQEDKEKKDQAATEHLIRQIFLPRESHQLDWRDRLPTLTSSDEVNIEIYALFGLICRQFVQTWYYKIVDDPAFIYDISSVLAHVVRQLEERVGQIDMYGFLLDELPMILDVHIQDIRMVRERYKSSLLPADTFEDAFHAIRPHPALSSPENEKIFLQILSKGITVFLLDPANLNSPLATSFISSILCDIGLKNAVEKLSEPWMLYEIITKVIGIFCPDSDAETESGKQIPKKDSHIPPGIPGVVIHPSTVTTQAGVLYTRIVRLCGSALARGGKLFAFLGSFASGEELSFEKTRVPLVGTSIFSLLDTLFQLNVKKPLLPATLRVFSIPFAYGRIGMVCNRVIDFYLHKFVGNEHTVSKIVRIARETLFPNFGPMGPGRVNPDAEEQAIIRAAAHEAIFKNTPETARVIFLGDDAHKGIDEILDLFANKQVNKHLVYSLLDHIVATLAPELVEMTPQELLNIKLGAAAQ